MQTIQTRYFTVLNNVYIANEPGDPPMGNLPEFNFAVHQPEAAQLIEETRLNRYTRHVWLASACALPGFELQRFNSWATEHLY